jgi:AhpD family alkylhydroperoxidase
MGQDDRMTETMYPTTTREIAQTRRGLGPAIQAAFDAFSRKVFADGALSAKMKHVIALAVAHIIRCPYCIKGNTKAARGSAQRARN